MSLEAEVLAEPKALGPVTRQTYVLNCFDIAMAQASYQWARKIGINMHNYPVPYDFILFDPYHIIPYLPIPEWGSIWINQARQQIPKDWQQRVQDPLHCLEIGAGIALPSLCDMAKQSCGWWMLVVRFVWNCLDISGCLKSPSFCPVLKLLKYRDER